MGLSFWVFRRRMRLVRWAVGILVVTLHLVMKAPVWNLIARIDLTGGSSSWHRFMLMDECIKHFTTWMLVGTTEYPTWGWEMWDLSNQYVMTADTAGLIPLIALVMIIVFAFKYVGRARRAVEGDKKKEMFIWGMGAALLANLVAFNGISYFDQTIVAWYCILAMVCAISLPARMAQLAPAPASGLSMAMTVGQRPSPFPAGNPTRMQNMPTKSSGYNGEDRVRPIADGRTLTNRKSERNLVK